MFSRTCQVLARLASRINFNPVASGELPVGSEEADQDAPSSAAAPPLQQHAFGIFDLYQSLINTPPLQSTLHSKAGSALGVHWTVLDTIPTHGLVYQGHNHTIMVTTVRIFNTLLLVYVPATYVLAAISTISY